MESLNHFHSPLESYDILKDNTRQEELVKIMIQTLEDLGYSKSAQKLLEESKVDYENIALIDLRRQILEGNWDAAIEIVNGLTLTEDQIKKAQFFIYEQKYIETVIEKSFDKALALLRDEVTSKCSDSGRLHKLAGLMMCLNVEQIEEKLNRSTDLGQARMRLLKELQAECKPSHMISANRFNKLLQQAVSFQIIKCPYHSKIKENFSLLEDHICDLESFPSKSAKTIEDQAEEVWVAKFSHDGHLVASLTKNMQLSIWEFNSHTFSMKLRVKKEKIHEKEVNCVNWSPDDTKIITASSDRNIKVWDAMTGAIKLAVQGHVDIICSAVWMPDNLHFISGGIDNQLIIWNMRGEQKSRISSPRVLELLLSSDAKTVYAVCAGVSKVSVIDLTRKIEKNQIKEQNSICSATLSKDNKFLLLNTSFTCPELHLWSLEKYELVQVYTGHFQEKYRIFCCFGGLNDEFIACGGEDSIVRVWHRNCSEPIAHLSGHALTVNCVSWHPKNPHILISAGDDHSIKFWASDDIHKKIRSKVAIDDDEALDMFIEGTQSTMDQLPDNF